MSEWDWRTLPAGPELERLIAERLGWHDLREQEIWEEDWYSDGFFKRWRGTDPEGEDRLVPRFSLLADAAIAPVAQLDIRWRLLAHGGRWYKACIGGMDDEIADTPALALNHALLAYLDWKEMLRWNK